MSGPKVVRIVTREEILALCEGHLARVDAAMAEWLRIGRRNDCVSDADIAQGEGRMARLRALLKADRFMDLQKQAPQEIAFLHQDMQSRLAKVADVAAQARSASRRQGEAAAALLTALRKKGVDLPADLDAALSRAADGQPDPQALSRGFDLLSGEAAPDAVARLALAQSLKDGGGKTPTLADWIAGQPAPPSDPVFDRFEGRLTELALLSERQEGDDFETRLATALAPAAEARRSLLLDSLDLDLTAALVAARQRQTVTQDLRLTLAELTLLDTPAAQAITARAERPEVDPTPLLADAQARLAKARDALAAQARRAAVLQSLAGLGYEVGEGLVTAWVDQGRVVLRKAAQPDYGVEISGDPAGARMQMRVVAFGDEAGVDTARDQDAETQWCGDVAILQSTLAAAGGDLVIERALPVGATPVKRVQAPKGALSTAAREGPSQRPRRRDA
jgi:hypothetical protein